MNQTNEGLSKAKGVMHIYSQACPCALCEQESKLRAEAPQGLASAAAMEVAKDDEELNDELQVMRSTVRALQKLPYEGQRRVLAWLNDRLPPRLLGLVQAGKTWP